MDGGVLLEGGVAVLVHRLIPAHSFNFEELLSWGGIS